MNQKKYFLTIENFKSGGKLRTEIISFDFPQNSLTAGSGASFAAQKKDNLTISRFTDGDSRLFINANLGSKTFPKVTMAEENFYRGGSSFTRVIFTLADAVIVSWAGSGALNGRQTQRISMDFRESRKN